MAISVVILAAGQGKRMRSCLPKVLQPLAGRALLAHVIDTAKKISSEPPFVVVGHEAEQVKKRFADVRFVTQSAQLGTGHALQQVLPHLRANDQVLVLYGDVPLISSATLKRLADVASQKSLSLITAHLANSTGYGRIKRNKKGQLIAIIEEKEASKKEKQIKEVNSGIYLLPVAYLKKWLPKLKNKNAQREYYLTDIVQMAVKEKIKITSIEPEMPEEILGINDKVQLANVERFYQHQQAEKWLHCGVTIYDPARFDVRGNVQIGQDTVIDVNVIMEGDVTIGKNCVIGPHVILRNVTLGDGVEVRAHTLMDGATVEALAAIGPFARVRPGSVIASGAHIGNFVEIKNSYVGEGSKVNHLSYIGDSEIGKKVNIGAGTITCNYDGVNKHRTQIGDEVFVGSGTQLVAPIQIGKGATIGAGSTVTQDAPPHQLTLTHRLEQRSVKEWKRPQKKGSKHARTTGR